MMLKLIRLFAPFAVIAKELTIIRELMELELASRPIPIRRVTEQPGRSDTEVFYTDVPTKPKSAMDKMKDILNPDDDDDDDVIDFTGV